MTRRRADRQAGLGIFVFLLVVIIGELVFIAWAVS